jgi:predicted PurR-regulated permease PerM
VIEEMDSKARSSVAILIVFIAFAWIGYAYIMGTEAEKMVLHPIVPILLIVLLLGFRDDDLLKRVTTIAIAFIVIWLLVRLQNVVMPFIIGFSIAYVVNVALTGLQNVPIPLRRGRRLYLPKGAAVALAFILIIGVLAFVALGIVPQLVEQAGGIVSFYSKVKDYTLKSVEDWERGEYPLKDRLPYSWQTFIEDNIERISVYLQDKIPGVFKRASELLGELLLGLSSGLMGTVGQVSSMFFILIIFVYAVGPFHSHMESLKRLLPEKHRETVVRYASEIDVNMRGFLKGQLTVIIILSGISVIVYSILRVPFALMVGLLAGLCNAIPNVGPIIGGSIAVLACLMGLVAGNIGLSWFLIQLLLVIGAAFGIQIFDNSLISPRIMSRALEVHPLVVIFAVLLAASLIGVWGAVLAIPGIVIFKAVVKVSSQIKAEREAEKMGLETGEVK